MTILTRRKPNAEKSLAIIKGSSINEPKVTEDTYNIDMVTALNWYGNQDSSKLRSYAKDYVNFIERTDYLIPLEKSSDNEIQHIGAIGRLILREQYVSDIHTELLSTKLNEILEKYSKKSTKEFVKEPTKEKTAINPNDIVNKFAAEIDEQLDFFVLNKKSDFSCKNFLLQNNISSIISKKIGNLYAPLLEEINSAVEGNDEDLIEGYNNFTRWQIRKYASFIQDIINECNQHSESVKVRKTVRKVTVKPASVVTAKVAYLREFPELGLKSINPSNIVNASELWVYNTVTRKIGVYYGADEGKLSVTGTTIINFDILKSVTKILRKPEETFKTLGTTNKRAMNNWFKTITSKLLPIKTGRLNSDTILLTAN